MSDDSGAGVLSKDEVGALFDAVRDTNLAESEAVGAHSVPRPFEPRPLHDGGENFDRVIARLHASLAIDVASQLSAVTRLAVSFELADAEHRPENEVKVPAAEYTLEMSVLSEVFARIHLTDDAIRAFADRQLGGPGKSSGERPLTELEKRVSIRPLNTMVGAAAATWQALVAGPAIGSVRPTNAGVSSSSRDVIVTPFRLTVGPQQSDGALIYNIEAVRRVLQAPAADALEEAPNMTCHLDTLPLRTEFLSDGFSLTVKELLSLERGQALAVSRTSDLKVDVMVEGAPYFRGEMQLTGGGRQVAIEHRLGNCCVDGQRD